MELNGVSGNYIEDSGMKGWRTQVWAGLGRLSKGGQLPQG